MIFRHHNDRAMLHKKAMLGLFLIDLVFFIALRFILGFHLLLSLVLFTGALISSFLLHSFLDFFSPWMPNEFISLGLVLWFSSFFMVMAGMRRSTSSR